VDGSAGGEDFSLATSEDFPLAMREDLELATREDFFMATDTLSSASNGTVASSHGAALRAKKRRKSLVVCHPRHGGIHGEQPAANTASITGEPRALRCLRGSVGRRTEKGPFDRYLAVRLPRYVVERDPDPWISRKPEPTSSSGPTRG